VSRTATTSLPFAGAVAATAPIFTTGLAFLLLFWRPIATLGRDWLGNPEAAHGLLLFPLALYLAWRRGLLPAAHPQARLGLALVAAGVALRGSSDLAAELFTMRLSALVAAAGLVVYVWGLRQLREWWLSQALLLLSIPIPALVLGTIALPLQLKASQLGAWLLALRHLTVQLAGNVIYRPGHALFVTEACSGLRSLTALLALGLLLGGVRLRTIALRAGLIAATIPVALALNGWRVFATGFLVYFVDPKFGDGFLHLTEGWVMFVVAFILLAALTEALVRLEQWWHPSQAAA